LLVFIPPKNAILWSPPSCKVHDALLVYSTTSFSSCNGSV
jgi:hypothetical protein